MEQEQNISTAENSNSGNHTSKKQPKAKNRKNRKIIGFGILLLVLVVGGYFGYTEIMYYQTHVETEDAQTDGYISPVLPRVSGYVDKVMVDDNEHVEKGQLLVAIDTTEYALKVNMARSALQNTKASLNVAQANLESANVALHKANIDYNRVQDLYKGGAATKSKFDDVQSERESARAQVAVAKRRLDEVQSQIEAKKDDLKYAKLQLSYTKITAPSTGLISKKDVEVGQLIQPGQPLMAVTDVYKVWVVANYKETELNDIRIGQKVNINVDAYPNKTFRGKVESIAGATGAKYALLPPENATGNFVKVVQRVPVKIVFTEEPNPKYPIRLGLNVTASIDITQKTEQANQTASRQ
ncbi:MAG TPA: HlyD family secretion protein [Balneolaceae bacterium]|nr:HlyD family secretion protein [Balneolaceae bacterium]